MTTEDANREVFGTEPSNEDNQAPEENVQNNEALDEQDERVTTYGSEQENQESNDADPNEAESEQEKLLAQANERAKFFQTGYQEANSRLKGLDPDYQNWKQGWKDDYKNPSEPDVGNQNLNESIQEDKYISDLTDVEFKKLVASETQRAMRQAYGESQEMSRLNNEMDVARQTLVDFVNKADVSNEEIQEAGKYAQSLGLDDTKSPKAVAQVVLDHIYMKRLMNNAHGGVTKAQADAAEKIKQSQVIQQPSPSAMPEKRNLTKEEKIIEQMKRVGNDDTYNKMFS